MSLRKKKLISQFKKLINNGGQVDKEHRDYILCKEVYHCSPFFLENVEERLLDLHFDFYSLEKEKQRLDAKRQEQQASVKRSN